MKKHIRKILVPAVAVLLLMTSVFSAMAEGKVVATGNANIRAGASLDSEVVSGARKGTKFDYAGACRQDDRGVKWYEILCGNGRKGWISSKVARLSGGSGKSTKNVVVATGGSCNIRKQPSLDARIVGGLVKGKEAKYLGNRVDDEGVCWYKVKYNGTVGWVSSLYAERG